MNMDWWVAFPGFWQFFESNDRILLQVLSGTSAVLAWAFVIRYGFWSPWRSTVVGRSLMYVWIALSVVLTLIATTYWFGEYPGRAVIRLLIYLTLPISFVRFLKVLVDVQNGRVQFNRPNRVEAPMSTTDVDSAT